MLTSGPVKRTAQTAAINPPVEGERRPRWYLLASAAVGAAVATPGVLMYGNRIYPMLYLVVGVYFLVAVLPRAREAAVRSARHSAAPWFGSLAVLTAVPFVMLAILMRGGGVDVASTLDVAIAGAGYVGPAGMLGLLVLGRMEPAAVADPPTVSYADLATFVAACLVGAVAANVWILARLVVWVSLLLP